MIVSDHLIDAQPMVVLESRLKIRTSLLNDLIMNQTSLAKDLSDLSKPENFAMRSLRAHEHVRGRIYPTGNYFRQS